MDTDKIVEQHGIKVMVDKKSYIYLVGTELEFSDGLNAGDGEPFGLRSGNVCGSRHAFRGRPPLNRTRYNERSEPSSRPNPQKRRDSTWPGALTFHRAHSNS